MSVSSDPRHQLALERFKLACEVWKDQREQEDTALKFQAGDQWPEDVKRQRTGLPANGSTPAVPARPMLTIRSLDQPIAQIVNQARQSELAINIMPRGSEASQDIADVFQGLIRKIQTDSHAQTAYLWAYQRAVPAGTGYFRIGKKAAEDGTPADNDQELTIDRILNGASVYLDPFAQDAEWRDGDWAFVTEDIPESRYKHHPDYQRTKLATISADDATFTSVGDELKEWVKDNDAGRSYRIAEYFYKQDGLVYWSKLNGIEFIDPPQEWDGPDIPIVPVLGNEYNVGGKRMFDGVVTPAIGPCRMLNYTVSSAAEQIGLTTKPKWIGYAGQFEGLPGWDESNIRNLSKLEAHAKVETVGNELLPLPRFDAPEAPIQAMTGMIQMQVGFIRSITGVPDASLGHVNPNDKSGKAIQALQQAAEQGTSNYLHNLARSIKRGGEILVNLIPNIYDRPGRVVQLLEADGKQNAVMLKQPFLRGPNGPEAANPGQMTPEGAPPQEIDLAQGKYAVVVEVSKNFSTRQAETREVMLNFAQIDPNLFPRFADLVAKTLGPEGEAIAERVKPPGVDDQTNLPPAIQQQIGQMQAELQQAKQFIETKRVEQMGALEVAKIQADSRREVAEIQAKAGLVEAELKVSSSDAQALLKAELTQLGLKVDAIMNASDQDHEGTIKAHEKAHDAGMAAEQRAHEQMVMAQQQAHEAEMGMQGHEQALEEGEQGHAQALEQGEQGHQQALEQGQQAADLAPEPAGGA